MIWVRFGHVDGADDDSSDSDEERKQVIQDAQIGAYLVVHDIDTESEVMSAVGAGIRFEIYGTAARYAESLVRDPLAT